MANVQISVYLSEEWVVAADDLAAKEQRTRNFILNRWLENGMTLERGGKWQVVEQAQDLEKIAGVPATRHRAVVVDSGGAIGMEGWATRFMEAVRDKGVEGDAGGPDPVLDVVVGEYGQAPKTQATLLASGLTGEPTNIAPFQPKVYSHNCGDHIAKDFAEVPVVPEEAFEHFNKLKEAQNDNLGVSDVVLRKPSKGDRTAAGIERVDQQLTDKATVPKPKKIAKVPAPVPTTSPRSGKEINDVQTQSPQPPKKEAGEKDNSAQEKRNSGNQQNDKVAGEGDRLAHDPKTCRMYGCLMCKLAKGDQ